MGLKRWQSRMRTLRDLARNRVYRADVHYVVENAAWSIRHDGLKITQNLPSLTGRITVRPDGVKDGIVHFGSINTWMNKDGVCRPVHPSNHTVCTWFHIVPEEARNQIVRDKHEAIQLWHSSCSLTRDLLLEMGIPEDRLILVPLGVDLNAFRPASDEQERRTLRRQLGIGEDRLLVGSFQKDGNGWGEGDTPKLIKGPDILCDVLEALAKELPITALLTGPARGYVKNRLTAAGVPFVYRNIPTAEDVAPYYRALDMYLISSRAEGGPKSLLESMASGIPVVTTPVGMAIDLGRHEENLLVGPPNELLDHALRLLRDPDLGATLAQCARAQIPNYGWDRIAQRYEDDIYKRL